MAFDSDPEAEIRLLNTRRGEIERALNAHEERNQQQRQQFEQAKEGISALNRLIPLVSLLLDDTLTERVEEITEELTEAQEAARHIQKHGASLTKLEPLLAVLQSDPQQHEQLKRTMRRRRTVSVRPSSKHSL